MAGEIMASQIANPYAKPKVLFPNHLTKYIANRSPSPVFTNPLLKKNDTTINHMTSFVKAAKADWKGSVFVTTEIVRHTKAQAPTGKGARIRPAMVVKKIANNRHACFETSLGLGIAKQMRSPMESEIAIGIGFAPGKFGNLMNQRLRRRWDWVGVGMVITVGLLVSGGGFDIIM